VSVAATISALVGVFGLAFFWFWGAIPAGIALGVNPILVTVTVWLSYVSGVVVIALVGGPLRDRIMARFAHKDSEDAASEDKPQPLIRRVWDRFGLVGLALLAPVTVGSQIGAALGLTLGVQPRRLTLGMALGAIPWAVGIMLATVLGISAARGGR